MSTYNNSENKNKNGYEEFIKLTEKVLKLIQNGFGDVTKILSDNQKFEFEKEIRLRSENVFSKLNEISDFLIECKERGVNIDTSELEQIHFRAYSLARLDEDVRKYFSIIQDNQISENSIEKMKSIKEVRLEIIDNIPRFLSPYFDVLFPETVYYKYHYIDETRTTDLEYYLTDFEENPLVDQETINRYEKCGYDTEGVGYKFKANYHDEYEIVNPTEIEDNDNHLLEAFDTDSELHVDLDNTNMLNLHPLKFNIIDKKTLCTLFKHDETLRSFIEKACNGDKNKAEKLYKHWSNTTVPYQNINVLESYKKLLNTEIREKIEPSITGNFIPRYMQYLQDSYDAYATALTHMKSQVANFGEYAMKISPIKK